MIAVNTGKIEEIVEQIKLLKTILFLKAISANNGHFWEITDLIPTDRN